MYGEKKNETKREFSRRQIVQGQIKQSRIDLILCTKEIESKIRNIYYKETGFSDHNYLYSKIDFTEVERGPGIWVLNAGLLKEFAYCKRVKRTIIWNIKNTLFKENKQIWWDNVKYEIKNFSIGYSKIIQKIKKQEEEKVRHELYNELTKWNENPKENEIEKITTLEDKLKQIEEEKF